MLFSALDRLVSLKMSEAIESVVIHQLPLHEMHKRLGASLTEREGWLVPSVYGGSDMSAEYKAVRDGSSAGIIDFSARARIELKGVDVVQFLNGLVTSDVKGLDQGAWMPAAFPNAQGRLLAFARILRQSSDSFLIDTEAVSYQRVLKMLERFTLAGDFRVTDKTNGTALLSVQGAQAARIIGAVLGEEAVSIEGRRAVTVEWGSEQVIVIRATHTGEDGFDVFVSAAETETLWSQLVDAGARPVGFDAVDTLRVEAGLPRYTVDMDESNVVTEAVFDDAVSYTKGCYIGQEIIARIHWRGHVARRLTGLSFKSEMEFPPLHGAKIKAANGKEIGRITSAVYSPRLNYTVALSYVKYDYLAPGTEVTISINDQEHAAQVSGLPFVRGSWSEILTTTPEPVL